MAAYSVEEAAQAYLARGWSVIPLRPRDKRPLVAWQERQQSHASQADVRGWFHQCPDANLGIVTGAVSGLVVVDVDPAHGGVASLGELERRHGALPNTIEAVSGGGGRHLYFAHPGRAVRNKAALAPGVDVRGDGGMIVAPPSVHPSGLSYAWRPGQAPDEAALAPLPRWLLDELLPDQGHVGHPISHWRQLVVGGVEEGSRNDTIASLSGHLLRHGVDPEVVVELLRCWNLQRCRPPLPDQEVVRTVHSIVRLHERDDSASTKG